MFIRLLSLAVAVGLSLQARMAIAAPTIELPRSGVAESPGQQLQDAVNDPANAGVRIRLARGAYLLDPTRPNGGRLFLQPGMELIGENHYQDCDGDRVWDPVGACAAGPFDPDRYTMGDSETLIDGSDITSALGGAAVIRAGRDNLVESVTVRAPRRMTVGGSLDINLPGLDGGMRAVVRDTILEGGQRGMRCNNGSPPLSGISSGVTVEGNIIRDNLPVPGGLFGFGFQLQNSGATGSAWKVLLRHNRITGTRFGLFVLGGNATAGVTDILSQGNVVHDNQAAAFLMTAFTPGSATPGDAAQGNRIRFTSQDDAFLYNVTPTDQPLFLGLGGGIVAFAAGRDSATAGASSRNQLVLELLHSTFVGNLGVPGPLHLTLVGSFSSPITNTDAGTDNEVRVLMRQTRSDGAPGSFIVADSIPEVVPDSNRVVILGADVAFEHTNVGWLTPSGVYFPPSAD